MKQEYHEKRTTETFGQSFSEVHVFLDQFYHRFAGGNHRRVLHHRRGVELVVRKFGQVARGPAELHITDDLGFLPENWMDLDRHFFPLREGEEEDMDRLIEELFGEAP